MKKPLEETAKRNRNIRWLVVVDELAKKMAKERNTTVSGFLGALVIKEAAINRREEAP